MKNKPIKLFSNAIKWLFAIFILQQISCGVAPVTEDKMTGPVFYPPLPNSPKIQFLTTINAGWIQGNKRTGFSDFILGKRDNRGSRLIKPYGVTYYNGQVIVVDARGPGYMVLTADDAVVKTVRGSGGGGMQKPINIFIDSHGNRYIADTGRKQVLVFDKSDEFIRAYGRTDQFQPSDVLVSGESVYVADLKHHIIHVLDKKSGFTRRTIGKRGSGQGELFYPTNMTMNSDGNLIVSDTGNYRLQMFSPQGKFIRQYGEAGSGLGQFARPKGVAVDKEDRVYAVDAAFENVQLFNKDGQLLLFFGKPGNDRTNINLPADISIHYNDIDKFEKFADEHFQIEYLIFVTSQYGPNKISVYGYGKYTK